MNFAILYGSMRDDRLGIRLVKFLVQKLEQRGHKVHLMDAKELNLPLLNKRYLDYKGNAPAELENIAEAYRHCDGFLIVAGEYNYGTQPGLKNLLDYFYHEYFFKPSALALYTAGTLGGIRTAMQLVQNTWALHMPTIPSFLSVSQIHEALNEDGRPNDPTLHERADKFLNQLEWFASALKTEREKGLPK